MTLLTALEIASNYPENIKINSAKQENGKFAAFCYMTKDRQIHKLMLSSQAVFETEKEANDTLHEICSTYKEKYS